MDGDAAKSGPPQVDEQVAPREPASDELETSAEEAAPTLSEEELPSTAAAAEGEETATAAPSRVPEADLLEPAGEVGAAAPAAADPHAAAEPDEEWVPVGHDMVPLLPRGTALFEGIPARAIVIDALCPAIGHGAVIVRGTDAVGVVLVEEGLRVADYAFASGASLEGEGARTVIHSWEDGAVAAYRFDPLVVAVLPSLFRGTPCYADLRLEWTDWHGLLADLCRRDGSFVVELDTPHGRGVTLIVDGRQVATYTDGHPELGGEDLLDPLAEAGRGTIWVQREPAEAATSQPMLDAVGGFDEQPGPGGVEQAWNAGAAADIPGQRAGEWIDSSGWSATAEDPVVEASGYAASRHAPAYAGMAASPNPAEAGASPFAPFAVGSPQPSPWPAPGPAEGGSLASASLQVPAADLAPQLKQLARLRLQRSASRVEAMIDEAAAAELPLAALLADVRGLVIRGVMQSSLDELANDMAGLVGA
jgi:hypothetical protein